MSPDDDNSVMSQADIDAMVSTKSELDGQAAAPPASQPAAAPVQESPPSAAPASPAGGGDSAALAGIVQRLEKLEAAVAKIGQAGGGDKKVQGNVETLAKHVKTINGQVNEIKKNLSNTLGYGVRETFQCTSCRTKGNVAARVLCTNCNKDTFVGWWPKR